MKREEFIERSKKVHNDNLGYDNVPDIEIYQRDKVNLYCKRCDVHFEQNVQANFVGKRHNGCKLLIESKHNLDTFRSKAKQVHGDNYGYDKVVFVNNDTPVTILCNNCGKYYEQKPSIHTAGSGHKPCTLYKNTKTTEQFKSEARAIHGDRYDYSKVLYEHTEKKVIIICRIHGEFTQTPHSHLKGYGCYQCGRLSHKDKVTRTEDEFLKLAKEVHGDKYDYSKINYTTMDNKIIIGCPIHGKFKQRASGHLKYGCARCGTDAITYTTESFIKKANLRHNNKYDYSKTIYTHSKSPVIITCPKHGDFKQIANEHLCRTGCPVCSSSRGEKLLYRILKNNNIDFVRQYKLGNTNYRYDFYLPELDTLIEYDGIQHFEPVEYFGGMSRFLEVKANDELKNTLALTHNKKLLRVHYKNITNLKDVLSGKIRHYIKYCRDGKYFKSFLEYSQYFKLPGDAKPNEHKQYLFKLK